MKGVHLLALAACLLAQPARADAPCRLALALGLDVSGSVDSREYALQVGGLIAALRRADVGHALLAQPEAPVSLLVYEWSGPEFQRVLAPWSPIPNQAALEQFAARLSTAQRQAAPPATALGRAVDVGRSYLAQHPGCWQHTLDISGDGKSNSGPHPSLAKARAAQAGVTVNALVIGDDRPNASEARPVGISELTAYFRAYVITGADAFVEVALGFDAYEEAMARKLKRELAQGFLSKAPAPTAPLKSRLVKILNKYSEFGLSNSVQPASKRW